MLGTAQSVDLLMHAKPPLQISAVPVPLVQEGKLRCSLLSLPNSN